MRKTAAKIILISIFIVFLFPAISLAEKVLVIDPGHGGDFKGTCGYSGNLTGFCEKDANLAVGLKLRDILKDSDITVYMTRETDKQFAPYLRLPNGESQGGDFEVRTDIANDYAKGNNDNSILISIHHNQHVNTPQTRGIETYYYDGINNFKPEFPHDPIQKKFLSDNRRLAEAAHENLLNTLGLNDRELRFDQSFFVLRNAQMPAILVELGYMTNPEEEKLIASEAFQQDAAQTLADTVINYFKVYEVFDNTNEKIKVFSEQSEAIDFAETLEKGAYVFSKDKQKVIFPNSPLNDTLFKLQSDVCNDSPMIMLYQSLLPRLFQWKQIGYVCHITQQRKYGYF